MKESEARRYPPGEFYYDFQFSFEVRNSRVLNQEFQVGEMDYLLQLKEQRLQMLQDELEDYIKAQKLSKQTAFNKGQKWNEDDRSREKRVTLEAKIDVVKWEISELEELIEESEKEKEKHDRLPVLPYGPIGINQVKGSTGSGYVDGQWSAFHNGVLVIVDERPTPYRGISVLDYIEHIAIPWTRASRAYNAQMEKKLLAEGKDVPVSGFSLPWPEWPPNVKNHLSNGQVTLKRKSEPKMKRTK